MTLATQPKTPSRYQLLRSLQPETVEARWRKHKTVLRWPEPERPVAPTYWPDVHTLGYQSTCSASSLCPIHAEELTHLLQTTPPAAKVAHTHVTNMTLPDPTYESIVQEATRHGVVLLSHDRATETGDEPDPDTIDQRQAGWAECTPYDLPTPRTRALIALERAMYLSSNTRIARVRNDGQIQLIGYGKLTPEQRVEVMRTFLVTWHKAHGWYPTLENLENHRQTVAEIRWQTGIIPESYFEVDEDPFRYQLHETDDDYHRPRPRRTNGCQCGLKHAFTGRRRQPDEPQCRERDTDLGLSFQHHWYEGIHEESEGHFDRWTGPRSTTS